MIPIDKEYSPPSSLKSQIRQYQNLAKEVENYLKSKPYEWGKFQSIFNYEVNGVFRQIMEFEKNNFKSYQEEKVYKLKKIFINRIRHHFLHGEYIVWSLKKPLGYAGDYKIIDQIYLNQPKTVGFERLFDNYFQMSSISVAVRNRKDDFKRFILEFINKNPEKKLRILDLGSGPCRELFELFSNDLSDSSQLFVDCLDNDQSALNYAKSMLDGFPNITFTKENAVRFALKKNIAQTIGKQYNLIYSTGLFDYFDDRLIIRLLQNLKSLLSNDGVLAVADVRDKYSNASVHFMEWVGDWNLIYRDDENFRQLFLEAGFRSENLAIGYEQQGTMQYIFARNS